MHDIWRMPLLGGREAAFMMPYIIALQAGIRSRVLKKQGSCSKRHCVTVCMAAVPMHSCRTQLGASYSWHLKYDDCIWSLSVKCHVYALMVSPAQHALVLLSQRRVAA